MSLDFTLEKYNELCQAIEQLGCPVMTIRDFLLAVQPQQRAIVLRHDVDRDLSSAIRMAELEATYNIAATYYLRTTRAVFKAEAIRTLSQLGHEVGYHYEVLTKARGNLERATALFEQEIAAFRQIVPIYTISMHGSPLTPWNNLDMWQTHHVEQFGLLGEAYLSINYANLYYFTDTGRSWDATRYNIRDHVPSRKPTRTIHSTDDLIAFLADAPDTPLFINAHPNRWTTGQLSWGVSAASDWLINQIKWVVATGYRLLN
jgi:hypothetical protein